MIGILQYEDSLNFGFSLCLSGDMTAEDIRETLLYAARSFHDNQVSNIERRARQFLIDVGHDPDRPGGLKTPAATRRIETAHLVLRQFRLLQNAMARRDCTEVLNRASEIWSRVSWHDFLIDHEAAIQRGEQFIRGPKRPRRDRLTRAIEEAFSELGLDAPFTKVHRWLRSHKDLYIDVDGTIDWTTNRGRDKSIKPKTLENRVAKIRCRLRESSLK